MDLDALINQLNRVEPEAINWRAMADLSAAPADVAAQDADRALEAAPLVLEPALLQRLGTWLHDQNQAGDPVAKTRILNQALEAWLIAKGA